MHYAEMCDSPSVNNLNFDLLTFPSQVLSLSSHDNCDTVTILSGTLYKKKSVQRIRRRVRIDAGAEMSITK